MDAATRQAYADATPPPECRLSSGGVPLSADKQKWLNRAFGKIRVERDTAKAAGNTRLADTLTNVLAELILVDGE